MLDKTHISKMLLAAATNLKANAQYLSEIDAKFGDGDHGFTMSKISTVMENIVKNSRSDSIKSMLEKIAVGSSGVGGGAAGPLWGAFFDGLAKPCIKDEIDPKTLKAMFNGAYEELSSISDAKRGDKTMLDALIPAAEAAALAPDDMKSILVVAAKASEAGAKDTENYQAKFGRAKFSKEKTIGTPDCGAVSMSIFFTSFLAAYES